MSEQEWSELKQSHSTNEKNLFSGYPTLGSTVSAAGMKAAFATRDDMNHFLQQLTRLKENQRIISWCQVLKQSSFIDLNTEAANGDANRT